MQVSSNLLFALNGILVTIIILLAIRFLNSRRQNQFRDDLWDASGKRISSPDQINRTLDSIALEPPPAEEETTDRISEKTDKIYEKTDKIARPQAARPAAAASPYRPPKFRGKPHEVLGIDADADKDTILAAYKHWIKCYHPDRVQHLGPGYVKQANARTEQLNEAKAILLRRFG